MTDGLSTPERLRSVRERIAAACDRAGRDPHDVRLVAVSKTWPPERVRELHDCGQLAFGENRIQEALEKILAVGDGPEWHFIGHLQSNKARQAVGAFHLIHGVDSEKLARELNRRAEARGVVQGILLQANLSAEPTKSGLDDVQTLRLAETIAGLRALDLRGLMTIPPPVEQPEQSRPGFAELRLLRDRCAGMVGLPLPELSMGMSDDFEVAIEEGATLVRVGRALFGPRIR